MRFLTHTVLERLSAFMLGALTFGLLLVACHPAHADIRYDDRDGDYAQVTGLPCPPQVPLLENSDRANWFLVLARLGGRTGTACAGLGVKNGEPGVPYVIVRFEDGQTWLLRLDAFRTLGSARMPAT